jgi:hypothetical protein
MKHSLEIGNGFSVKTHDILNANRNHSIAPFTGMEKTSGSILRFFDFNIKAPENS